MTTTIALGGVMTGRTLACMLAVVLAVSASAAAAPPDGAESQERVPNRKRFAPSDEQQKQLEEEVRALEEAVAAHRAELDPAKVQEGERVIKAGHELIERGKRLIKADRDAVEAGRRQRAADHAASDADKMGK